MCRDEYKKKRETNKHTVGSFGVVASLDARGRHDSISKPSRRTAIKQLERTAVQDCPEQTQSFIIKR